MDFTSQVGRSLIPLVAIIGGITLAIVKTMQRTRLRELELRERIAMIERGMIPPPETDPNGFDRGMSRFNRRAGRHRSAGIILMGVGAGLTLLIWSAGEERGGAVGAGGFLFVLGLAFLASSLIDGWSAPPGPPRPPSGGPPAGPPPAGP